MPTRRRVRKGPLSRPSASASIPKDLPRAAEGAIQQVLAGGREPEVVGHAGAAAADAVGPLLVEGLLGAGGQEGRRGGLGAVQRRAADQLAAGRVARTPLQRVVDVAEVAEVVDLRGVEEERGREGVDRRVAPLEEGSVFGFSEMGGGKVGEVAWSRTIALKGEERERLTRSK